MHSLADVLGVPFTINDVRMGVVAAVLVDAECKRAIGLDIRLSDGGHRFLPWVAVEIDHRLVRSESAFLLVDVGDSYTRLGARALDDAGELGRLRADSDGTLGSVRPVVSSGEFAGITVR